MDIVTSGCEANDDATGVMGTEAIEPDVSASSMIVKTEPISPGRPNSDGDKNASERDSNDEQRSSPVNDDDENESDSDESGSSSSSEDESDSGRDNDSDSATDKQDDGISAYERLRIERIRRNEERLKQLGLVDPNQKFLQPKKKKRSSFGGARKKRSKENLIPKRSQPKRTAKIKLDQGELLSGGPIDLRRSWPLRQSYKGRFGRPKDLDMPKREQYAKRYHCGECKACTRETDCQTCVFCALNQRPSSSSTVRRRCLFRMCLRRLIDVEVDVEPEAQENSKEDEEKASVNEKVTDQTTEVDGTIDKDSKTDKENATISREIDVLNDDTMGDGVHEFAKKVPDSKLGPDDEPTAKESEMTDEKAENDETEETTKKKIPIENSEYFATYRMEEDESGLPKWLDEFFKFMTTVPHGPMNRISGQRSAENTMNQICKLVSGEGVTYHLWPEGTYFKKGIKIHLGMDLSTLLQEAIAIERRYEDRRKGSLLRHPIAKMICYKEWIADGKPEAQKEPPMSPLLTLPPPTSDISKLSKTAKNETKPMKRIVAMTLEQRIKPNRVRWASGTLQGKADGTNDYHMNTTNNKASEDRNTDNDPNSSNDTDTKSNLKNDDENVKMNENVENKNHMDRIEVAKSCVDGKLDSNISPGDNSENGKELFSITASDTKCSEAILYTINGTTDIEGATNVSANEAICRNNSSLKNLESDPAAVQNELTNTDMEDMSPNSCSVCSGGGYLICCDGCNLGFHSNCHIPKIRKIPLGEWFCKNCTRKRKPQKRGSNDSVKREVGVNKKLFKGEHGDYCYVCGNGGELICCDFCEKVYHLECHIPALPFVPEGLWKCCECLAVERKKKSDAMPSTCAIPRRKRGRPRKSAANDDPTIVGHTKKRGRPRKLADGDSLAMKISDGLAMNESGTASYTAKKGGRPRKSVNGDGLAINDNDSDAMKRRLRPRKSVDDENLPGVRESVKGDDLPVERSDVIVIPTKKKRALPRIVEGIENSTMERADIVTPTEKKRVVFNFKISSLKTAYNDPESTKIRKVIKSATRDPSDSKAVDKACEKLRKCMKSEENVKTAMLFGGVEMICSAMRDHPDKRILQAEACCTLAEMIWVFPGISTKLAHMGAIDLIVTSIQSCPTNSKVQQMGCGALGAFSYDESFTQHIMDAGGLQAVVDAMERFPKKLAVLMEGCYFFQNLIARSVDALSIVSNSQVVPIIVEAMSLENLDTDILLPMCGLIANLAVNEDGKEFIGQSDAIPATISVLNSSDDGGVKLAACTVLQNLAVGSGDNQRMITENEGLEALFGAICSHPSDALLLITSFNLMKELCIDDEDAAYQIVKNGGIKIILKAMQKHNDLATVQVAACRIIGYLLLEGKSEIHAPKLVKAIVTAMKNHSENCDVQILGCDALFELSQVSTTRLILKKQETQNILLRAKRHFKSCESDVDDIIAASKK